MKQNILTVPVAIILAGILIGGAVIYSNKGNTSAVAGTGNQMENAEPVDINIRPVDTSDHIVGNPNAKAVIIEYSDTECPFCKVFHQSLNRLVNEYGKDGKFTWVYRHFPLDALHKKARNEAEATECAAELGGNITFWEYINLLYETTGSNDKLDPAELSKMAVTVGLNKTAFDTCLTSGKHKDAVEDDVKEAMANGGRGTPFSIFVLQNKANKDTVAFVNSINGQYARPGSPVMGISKDERKIFMSGALPYDILKQIVEVLNK